MTFLRTSAHLDDATLLLAAEGELSPREAQQTEKHLRECHACRNRQAVLTASDDNIALPITPVQSDAARERLRTTLMEEQRAPRTAFWLRPRFYIELGIVAALLLIALTWRQAYSPLQDQMAAYEETGPEPNHVLTPGAVNTVELTELCTLSDNNLDPKVSPDKERAVFQAYGMDATSAKAYQVDYLINPQLGGNDDTANLWPEPYHATVWNATAKDALEARLHGMVCHGQITLEDAQHDLAADWIAAYKKYFHAARPLRTVAIMDAPAPQP
jgi:hypothetical protein